MICPVHRSAVTAKERELIRRELCRHFGQDPNIADCTFLRTWRGRERQRQPKVPPAVQRVLDRGLVEVRSARFGAHCGRHSGRDAGIADAATEQRAMDPERSGLDI